MLALVSVTIEPGSSVGRIRDLTSPDFVVNVEEQQIKLFPPFERYAPSTKSSCPPAHDIFLIPADSALTCPNKSRFTALLIDIKLSSELIERISLV